MFPFLTCVDEDFGRVLPESPSESIEKALQSAHLLLSLPLQILELPAGAACNTLIGGCAREQRRPYGRAAFLEQGDHLAVVIPEENVRSPNCLRASDESAFLIRHGLRENTAGLGRVLSLRARTRTIAL